jgi:hypothetical protein
MQYVGLRAIVGMTGRSHAVYVRVFIIFIIIMFLYKYINKQLVLIFKSVYN